MQSTGLLQAIAAALRAAGIPFMLTGSLASAYHGAGRSTMDIDIVVDPTPEQLRALIAALPSERYYASLDAALEAHDRKSLFNVVDIESGWKVDLIVRKLRPFSSIEFDRRIAADFDGVPIAVATVEDVIISKLECAAQGGSARQLEDVAGLVRARGAELDRAYLARWIGELGLADQWKAAQEHA